MAYKVTFNTYAIMGEDEKTGKPSIGNIAQSTEVVYTDRRVDEVELAINADLEGRKRVCEITNIEKVKGKCLF
jgi:hypothetical protein